MVTGKGLALGAGIGGLLTYLLTHPSEVQSSPPDGVDSETWAAIIAIITTIQEQNARLETALSQVIALMGGSGYALTNPNTFVTGGIICAAAAPTSYPIPGKLIPWDKEFVVKALSTNAGLIYIANNQVDAGILSASYPMLPNEAIGLAIANSSEVWVAAQFAGEGIAFTVEQK